ncbi:MULTISPECIES: glycosyltransferase [unclassified Methanosarcina]|uniref:glycosyltransferase n=1 Tax=unclassified Methanosarcina TaxID=2644672 RepID=UPI0012E04186|nr:MULTISPECIES: glycosyltransferase [unclassified Methanosarcina]
MSDIVFAEINSKEWWEEYFKIKWEINRGKEQTEYFMQLIIENLPVSVKKYLDNPEITILDWGCALGQGVNLLQTKFPSAKVKGLDISETAIEKAKNEYKDLSFVSGSLSELNEEFSVIVCSNCLEHFADPKPYFKEHLTHTKDIYIALVPYREENRIKDHEISLSESFFPDKTESFQKIYSKILDTRSSVFWYGYQLLVIYANKSLNFDTMKRNDDILINSQSPQLWDNVAETYSETANITEIKLGQEIEQLFLGLGIEPGASLLEVGCGSGHLSGYLAGKGFHTTLIDFSKVALEKAKEHYEQNNLVGNYIHANMFDLSADLVEPHDVVWNSGVLEHFDAWDVIEALKRMGQVARKYVLILVPNAKSIPYLLFRQKAMEKGEWIWGRELLRDSMKHLAEAAGLEVIEEQHIGKHFSYDQFTYVNSEIGTKYQDIDQQLLPREQNYLIALIARPRAGNVSIISEDLLNNVIQIESNVEKATYSFDQSASNYSVKIYLRQISDLSSKINDLNNKILSDELSNKTSLSNLNKDYKSQIEIKDHELLNKDDEILNLQKTIEDLRLEVNRINDEASTLKSTNEKLQLEISNKDFSIDSLSRVLQDRENSLSWRFSQYYGKYFEINSPVTRFLSSFLNKFVGAAKKPQNISETSPYERELEKILGEHKGKVKGIIVYPPTVDWNIPLFQRPQQLALAFSKLGYLFFYSVGDNKLDKVDGFQKIQESLYLTNKYDLLVSSLSELILLLSCTNPNVMISDIKDIKRKGGLVIYDYIDEISQDIIGPILLDDILHRHQYMLKSADIFAATADKLVDNVANQDETDIHLIPNGVDYNHFGNLSAAIPIPKDLKNIVDLQKPIIGYYGALSIWFDFDLIEKLAESRPQYEIVLIGMIYDETIKTAELNKHSNIHYLGSKDYSILPEYAKFFDVATIPFVLNEITESTNPIKLFEYMALEKPIVSTNIRECRKYRSVLIGTDKEDFIDKVDQALQLRGNSEYLKLLSKEAKENTWDARAKEFDQLISEIRCDKLDNNESVERGHINSSLYFGQEQGKVSVILPVYNQADLLDESLQSVLNQTYQNFELIIVNDGSRDGVERVLNKYVDNPKIRVLSQQNQKLPKALNNGFFYAKGEFFTWTSADNIMDSRQLEVQVNFLKSNTDADMVYCDYEIIDDRGEPLTDSNFRVQNQKPQGSSFIHLPKTTEHLNEEKDNFIGACFMYRGLVGKVIGDYDPFTFGCEDYDYWMRINSLFNIQHLGSEDILYRYRVHDNTLNAKAEELGIYERVNDLMEYDKERRAFYKKPFEILFAGSSAEFENMSRYYKAEGNFILEGLQDIESISEKSIVFCKLSEVLSVLQTISENPKIYKILVIDQDIDEITVDESTIKAFDRVLCFKLESFNILHHDHNENIFYIPDFSGTNLQIILKLANNAIFYQNTRATYDKKLPEIYIHRKLNILLLAPNLNKGGLEQVVYDLSTNLDKNMFNVYVAYVQVGGYISDKCLSEGVSVIPINNSKEKFTEVLKNYNIDIINTHYSNFGLEIAKKMNIPVVSTIHNNYVWFQEHEISAYLNENKYISSYIAVSKNVKKYSRHYFKIDPEKINVIPNGVNFKTCSIPEPKIQEMRARLGLLENDYVFLVVAGYSGLKSHINVISAMKDLANSYANMKVIFVGPVLEEDYYKAIEKKIREYGLQSNIIQLKFVSDEDMHCLYQIANAFLLPSLIEGWSISVMEAMHYGLPLILTDVGSAREVIKNSDIGIIIPNAYGDITNLNISNVFDYKMNENLPNLEILKKSMIDFYTNNDKWSVSGKIGIKRVNQEYNLDAMIRKYEQLYLEVYVKNNTL